jgi:hypothetical protein
MIYLHSEMAGAPAAQWSVHTAGALCNVLVWAAPLLGWTVTQDDRPNRVAITNFDGVTYVFYENTGQVEYGFTVNSMAVIRMFDGFRNFDDFDHAGPTESGVSGCRYFGKKGSASNATTIYSQGYRIYGDNKSIIFIHYHYDNLNNINFDRNRPRLYMHYWGRVNSIRNLNHNQVVLGAKYWGTNYMYPSMGGCNESFHCLYNSDGTYATTARLTGWQGMAREASRSWFGTAGWDENPMTGERTISRPLFGFSSIGYPWYAARGFYTIIGDWRVIARDQDHIPTPVIETDVGPRNLLPILFESTHLSNSTIVNHEAPLLLDVEGPWA